MYNQKMLGTKKSLFICTLFFLWLEKSASPIVSTTHLITMHSVYIGQSKALPVLNCRDLKLKVPSAASGVYWIDPEDGSHRNAFQAYCNQQTAGGGWTLVWRLQKFWQWLKRSHPSSYLDSQGCQHSGIYNSSTQRDPL